MKYFLLIFVFSIIIFCYSEQIDRLKEDRINNIEEVIFHNPNKYSFIIKMADGVTSKVRTYCSEEDVIIKRDTEERTYVELLYGIKKSGKMTNYAISMIIHMPKDKLISVGENTIQGMKPNDIVVENLHIVK